MSKMGQTVSLIQRELLKLEKQDGMSPELYARIHQWHGEMYAYVQQQKQAEKKLLEMLEEVSQISGRKKVNKH